MRDLFYSPPYLTNEKGYNRALRAEAMLLDIIYPTPLSAIVLKWDILKTVGRDFSPPMPEVIQRRAEVTPYKFIECTVLSL